MNHTANITTVPTGSTPKRRASRHEKRLILLFALASVVIGVVGGFVAWQLLELMATGDVVCDEELAHHGVVDSMLLLFGLLAVAIWSLYGAVAAATYSEASGWRVTLIATASLLVVEGFLAFMMCQLVLWCPA